MSDMHVMHVIDSMHGGGAEISLLEMAPALMSRGVRMSIVTLLADDGVLEDRLGTLGITCIRLERRDPLRLVLELRKIICAEHPDLVHTTLLFANMVGSEPSANWEGAFGLQLYLVAKFWTGFAPWTAEGGCPYAPRYFGGLKSPFPRLTLDR